jgi:hypothetical protein
MIRDMCYTVLWSREGISMTDEKAERKLSPGVPYPKPGKKSKKGKWDKKKEKQDTDED